MLRLVAVVCGLWINAWVAALAAPISPRRPASPDPSAPPFIGVRSWGQDERLIYDNSLGSVAIGSGACFVLRDEPGCDDADCAMQVCSVDPWCCDAQWDIPCLTEFGAFCDNYFNMGFEIFENASTVFTNVGALYDLAMDVACYEGPSGVCVFGPSEGQECDVHEDCLDAYCGFFSAAYPSRFFYTAASASVRISTCETEGAASDTVLGIYATNNAPLPTPTALIGCSDNINGCSGGRGADVCLVGLNPGDKYFVAVQTIGDVARGLIQLDLQSPCDKAQAHVGQEAAVSLAAVSTADSRQASERGWDQDERKHDPYLPTPWIPPPGVVAGKSLVERNGFTSIQVNTTLDGANTPGDAANEPSIAADPLSPNRIVIGWRQFDSVASDFRQAAWAYSHDGGQTWTFPGVLEPGVFRSDPVLGVDGFGNFHYYSLIEVFLYDLFTSLDGGKTWPIKTYAHGGDKGWLTIDHRAPGAGNMYTFWLDGGCCGPRSFARSTDGGVFFERPLDVREAIPGPSRPDIAHIAVGPSGEVYVGDSHVVYRSDNAQYPAQTPQFVFAGYSGEPSSKVLFDGPNPGGLLGQTWLAVDHSDTPRRGYVYALSTIWDGAATNVVFRRSSDAGATWKSQLVHLETDGWQWFGTMCVAPSGRIDVFWNDTAATGAVNLSELYYSTSGDGGETFSKPLAVSPAFDTFIGWPNQNKIGDYYHCVSDGEGVSLAYAATFNGEQDVYFLRLGEPIACPAATGGHEDCNVNGFDDRCERDFDQDELIDECDDDVDGDGIPDSADVCGHTRAGVAVDADGRPHGDTNDNCDLDHRDYWRLANCMSGGFGVPSPQQACDTFNADGDLWITLDDYASFQNGFGGSGR
jgi:hypothetical protein